MAKTKIVFLLRGQPGMGHVTPSLAIAEMLEKASMELHFITYSNGAPVIKAKGYKNVYVLKSIPDRKEIVPWKEMFEVDTEILPIIKKIGPKAIIIDGEFDAAFLLKGLGHKVIFITTKPYVDQEFDKYNRRAAYLSAAISNMDLLIVHGIEKPKKKFNNLIFVGPLVRSFSTGSAWKTLIPVSIGTEMGSILKIKNTISRVLHHTGHSPYFFGAGKSSSFVKEPLTLKSKAKFIISHGGMASIEEAAVLGKPMLLICDDDAEKSENAKSAKQAGLAQTIHVKNIRQRTMAAAIKAVLRMKPKKMKNGAMLATKAVLWHLKAPDATLG